MFPFIKSNKKQDREARESLHKSKMKLLNSIAEYVKEQSTRKKLPEKDSMVQYLNECSAKDRLKFKYKIIDYSNEMERCTARIEARLARQAVEDLDKGDYSSSRIKPYERFLKDIINGDKTKDDYRKLE